MIEALAAELRSGRAALSLVSLRLGEAAGLLPAGSCARIAARGAVAEEARELRARTSGALPPWPLPRRIRGKAAHAVLTGPAPEPEPAPAPWPLGESLRGRGSACFAFALCAAAEELFALRLGEHRRRSAGLYYTPPAVAAEVVALALRHGSSRSPARVLDPCAGAGAFLCAAAAAVPGARLFGVDLHAEALRAARAALALARTDASLRRADSLRADVAPADLVVGNPPYGHVGDPAGRAFLLQRLPALRGGEIDRYAAFLLRSLELLRPGGTAALLVPDTWMTNARSGPLRKAVLDAAEIAAVCDLGKPFAAAKDTRVQAVVLVRRTAAHRSPRAARVLRGRERLADALRAALPPADLVVGNPPYGHVGDPAGRAFLLRRLPALRGGEIDRYAAFLLRSLELLRPGGTAALLVPDTWMTNARSGPLREAVLEAAEIAAVCDLGKPFAAAKDTRVQAVVLVRRSAARRTPRPARVLRGRERLADATQREL
ncbi:MAG: Eco57I restriction-modification methylase domain-containing protein, partial [Myxococcales bacterium]